MASWDQVGKLTSLVTSHAVQVGSWELLDFSEPEIPELTLRPTWAEQQGVGGPTVTAEDTLSHDAWGRVRKVRYLKNGGMFGLETFEFDVDGNIRPSPESRTFDVSTTRLTTRAGDTYAYDRAGNLVTWTTSTGVVWTYGYDALERLVSVHKDEGLLARYAYDVLGRRIVKRVYSGPNAGYVRMIYAGDAVRAEANETGTLTLAYTWGLGVDNLVAIRRYSDNGHWYVVQDLLRSTRGLTRRDGTWLASWRYGIYGLVIDSAGSAPVSIRHRWTGREFDQETGFYYFRARYYDPASQRFVQEDPIGYVGGANLYTYVDGNPTNGRDPSGLAGNWERMYYDIYRDNNMPAIYLDGVRIGGGLLDGLHLSTVLGLVAMDARAARAQARMAAYAYTAAMGTLQVIAQALTYDCSQGQCPTAEEMVANRRLMGLLNRFFDLSQRAGVEFGAYLVMDEDGTIRIGPSGQGVQGSFDFRTLGRMPHNTIAMLHTHPDEGGFPGGAPFSGDNPTPDTIYGIVMNRDFIWFLTPWDPPGWQFRRH